MASINKSLLKLLRETHDAVICNIKEHRIVRSFTHILVTVVDNPTSSTTISTNDSYIVFLFHRAMIMIPVSQLIWVLIFIYCTLHGRIKGTKCALFSIK